MQSDIYHFELVMRGLVVVVLSLVSSSHSESNVSEKYFNFTHTHCYRLESGIDKNNFHNIDVPNNCFYIT